ncbi:MAG: hypothetical protein ACE5D3_05370, partial [Candidatus Binatia bacterium]
MPRSLRGLERLQIVELPSGRSLDQVLKAYAQDHDVEYAEPDATVRLLDTLPDDPKWGRLWGM